MNHAVLYVKDARKHQEFYRKLLDFSTVIEDPGGGFVFMRAPESKNHHDIAFFSVGHGAGRSEAGKRTVGMYHIAWEVPSLKVLLEMERRLKKAGVLIGASDHGCNKSLYAHDPDGLEFEVMWLVPPEHWGEEENQAIIRPLDIAQEITRFSSVKT